MKRKPFAQDDSTEFQHVLECLVRGNYTPSQVFNRLPQISDSYFSLEEMRRKRQGLLRGMGWLNKALVEYARNAVLERDKGVCASCGINAVDLQQAITWYAEHRSEHMVSVSQLKAAIGKRARRWPKRLFDIDHKKAIAHGGPLYALVNLQTLCLECHYQKTKLQAQRRLQKKQPSPASNPTEPKDKLA